MSELLTLQPPAPEQGFVFTERDGLTLVVPRKDKWSWTPEERPFRSVILDRTGRVVSAGFCKFGNHGEPGYEDHAAAFQRAMRNPDLDVFYTDKADGSLCIRSVIDGEVVFRTRGTFDGGPFGPVMRRVAQRKYPVLLDPEFEPDRSLHFEFVSSDPSMQIVIPYDEDDLIFLGAARHGDLRLMTVPEMDEFAAEHDLRLVERYELPRNTKQLLAEIRDWKGREGVVVRVADGQVLLKVKSEAYLLLHRLRTQLTAKGVRELCEDRQITSVDHYREVLAADGGDWEMLSHTVPYVQTYLDAVHAARERALQLDQLVTEAAMRYASNRKGFATEFVPTLTAHERPVAFLLLDGRVDNAEEKLRKTLLDDAFDRFAAAEAEQLIADQDE